MVTVRTYPHEIDEALHLFKCKGICKALNGKLGNMPYQVTEYAKRKLFSRSGQVTNVKIVYDRGTGRAKGFGFVEFADERGAQNAVMILNGAVFDGRTLRVNLATR